MSLAFRSAEGGGCDIIDDGDDDDDDDAKGLVDFADDDDDDTALSLVTGKLSRFFAVVVTDRADDDEYTHQSSRPISWLGTSVFVIEAAAVVMG